MQQQAIHITVALLTDAGEAGEPQPRRSEEGAVVAELLAGRTDRDGRALPDWLVDGCVASVGLPVGMAARASAVQAECWAWLLAPGAPDLVAIAPTGSGKTLAFLVPALCHLLAHPPAADASWPAADASGATPATPRVLVLAPTRELCLQTATATERIFAAVCADPRASAADPAATLALACVYGGVDFHRQRRRLLASPAEGGGGAAEGGEAAAQPPRLIVATPGRLLALCGEVPESTRARQRAAAAANAAAAGGARGRASRGGGLDGGAEEEAGEALAPACALHAVSLLVLDEADRLLDMGFEPDVLALRRLIGGGAPNGGGGGGGGGGASQGGGSSGHGASAPPWTQLFSATWEPRARALAASLLRPAAVHVTVGSSELAVAATVAQRFEVLAGAQLKGAARVRRLLAILKEFLGDLAPTDGARRAGGGPAAGAADGEDAGADGDALALASDEDEDEDERGREADDAAALDAAAAAAAPAPAPATAAAESGPRVIESGPRVILFVLHKQEAKSLARFLEANGFAAVPLHGDMSQAARLDALAAFRAGAARVLVATDVAARGLDVRGVSHVLNFSLGGSLETYVHRVGRCGRAGARGIAHSFVVDGDEATLGPLVAMLRRARAPVPDALVELGREWAAKAAKAAKAAAGAAGAGARAGTGTAVHGARGGDARGGGARGGGAPVSGGGGGGGGSDDEGYDSEAEARNANRERQLAAQKAKMSRERSQQKPGKHGRRK
jgi:superfamily II DNA/RNA helicase